MKKYAAIAFMALIFLSIESITPKSSEAGITCNTDFYGNTRCVDSGSGFSSNSRTDFYGNTRHNFSDGSSMTCRTDFYGNLRCN
jgi:hypothetical protein